MFNDLHLDLFQHIYDYLTQQELLNTAFICQIYYHQLIIYLKRTKFTKIINDKSLENVCENNYIISIKQIQYKNTINIWHWGFRGACYGGHMNIVQLMIEKGANQWNYVLYAACKGGHMNIIKLMIEKGANECHWCWKSMKEHLTKCN